MKRVRPASLLTVQLKHVLLYYSLIFLLVFAAFFSQCCHQVLIRSLKPVLIRLNKDMCLTAFKGNPGKQQDYDTR